MLMPLQDVGASMNIPELQFSRELRKRQTDAEEKLWFWLRRRHVADCKFRRQHPIGPYVVDFACIQKWLVVELDGGQHLEQLEYDERRTVYLREYGWRVVRFWDDAVLNETELVVEHIFRLLENLPSPWPSPASGRGDASA
jgi:very-short-patch-repair endonuclease